MPETIPVETLTDRRLTRVGVCAVLEVTVTYPHIPHESPAAARFNEAYRSMAESFLAWADTAPAEEARASFAAMGSTAPYRFDRRILTCSMTAFLSRIHPTPLCFFDYIPVNTAPQPLFGRFGVAFWLSLCYHNSTKF